MGKTELKSLSKVVCCIEQKPGELLKKIEGKFKPRKWKYKEAQQEYQEEIKFEMKRYVGEQELKTLYQWISRRNNLCCTITHKKWKIQDYQREPCSGYQQTAERGGDQEKRGRKEERRIELKRPEGRPLERPKSMEVRQIKEISYNENLNFNIAMRKLFHTFLMININFKYN